MFEDIQNGDDHSYVLNKLLNFIIIIIGKVKSIGVSNYTVKHLEELLTYATIKPHVLQVYNCIINYSIIIMINQ